jgi:hypothetical protein
MPQKTYRIYCRVPSALLEDDILPYVQRKLDGVGGLWPSAMSMASWLPSLDFDRTWIVDVLCRCDESVVPRIDACPIVLGVEEYVPPPPPKPFVEDDGDWEPSGVLASPPPLREPFETLYKVAGVVIGTPLFFLDGVRRRVRSRFYRHFV